jgi:uncharacterized protein YjiS (DUF1127 family)
MENLNLTSLQKYTAKWWSECLVVRYWKYLKTWRKHRDTIKQLNSLSDRDLLDIGISRWQIDELIFKEEDRMKRGSGNGSLL